MVETMNIHQALSELKLLNKRIEKSVTGALSSKTPDLIGYKKISSQGLATHPGMTLDEYTSLVQSNYDSVPDLIQRYGIIKSAIVLSNATTHVVVAGKTMTVAEAIERKNLIQYDRRNLNTLKRAYQEATDIVRTTNNRVESDIINEIDRMNQASEKRDVEYIEAYSKSQRDMRSLELVDPLKLAEKIENLEQWIETFSTEVDYVLSTSNATTFINIEIV